MKTIVVECAACREIENIAASCLLVEVGNAADEHAGPRAAWICGSCQVLVTLDVDLTTFVTLVAGGASVLDSTVDTSLPVHPETAIDGPAFTADDLLDLHEQLKNDVEMAVELLHHPTGNTSTSNTSPKADRRR